MRTTNNRMELMAVIAGLEALNRPCEVEVYSDSQYVVNAFNQHWVDGWIKKGWKRGKNEPVKKCGSLETASGGKRKTQRDIPLGKKAMTAIRRMNAVMSLPRPRRTVTILSLTRACDNSIIIKCVK